MGSVLDDVRAMSGQLAERDAADPETYPAANVAGLIAAGVLRSPFAPAQGGRGARLPELTRVIETVAAASPSTALLLAMPLGLAALYGLGPEVAPEDRRGVGCNFCGETG